MIPFSYRHFFDTARQHKWIVPITVAAALGIAFIGLNIVTPKYTGQMIIGPTAQTGVAARGIRLPLETIQNEKIRGNPAETDKDESLSDFTRAIQLLTSPEVAGILLKDTSLPIEEKLLQQRGVFAGVKSMLWKLAGQRVSEKHDAAALSSVLADRLSVGSLGRSPMRAVSFRDKDRDFTIALLNAVYKATDTHLREQAQARTASEIAFLRVALNHVTLSDQRKALSDLLMAQEQTQLLISVDLPFAADQIQAANASANADWPPIGLVLFFALCIGLFSGFSIVYALAVKQWQSQSV